jgi:hypothetical protein
MSRIVNKTYRALYDYESQEDDELSVKEGLKDRQLLDASRPTIRPMIN